MVKSIPEIEVYARPFGYLQWVCPNCHEIHGAEQVSGRSGRIRCGACKRVYRLGFSFRDGGAMPPYNALLNPEWNGYTVNRVAHLDPHPTAVGRFRGRVDWVCPICGSFNSGGVGTVFMDAPCTGCHKVYYLAVIFHVSKTGVSIKTPLDWSLPTGYEAPTDLIHTLVAPQAGEG